MSSYILTGNYTNVVEIKLAILFWKSYSKHGKLCCFPLNFHIVLFNTFCSDNVLYTCCLCPSRGQVRSAWDNHDFFSKHNGHSKWIVEKWNDCMTSWRVIWHWTIQLLTLSPLSPLSLFLDTLSKKLFCHF